MMNKRKISAILLWCVAFQVSAQGFQFKANVAPVSTEGYYKIALSPSLLGNLKPNGSDLRIYNETGQEQPYFLRQEQAVSRTSLFVEYEILEEVEKKNAISHIIFHNPDKAAIDNVSLRVRNTDVKKRARLSGSEDQENWYVIKNDYLLHSMASSEETTELKILDFPLSNYKYFKLEINDNKRLPIDIIKVGYYDTKKIEGRSTVFDFSIAYQKDSVKKSFIKLDLPTKNLFEKLHFKVSGSDYYSRLISVMVKEERLNAKKVSHTYYNLIGSFYLNSNSENEIQLGEISAQELYIEIDNKDDQPLTIEKVRGSYLNRYMIAKLLPTSLYTLQLGDEMLKAPQYDLKSFANQIPDDIPQISHTDLTDLREKPSVESQPTSIFESPYFIWSIIGIVGIVLGFVSLKMVREIGK